MAQVIYHPRPEFAEDQRYTYFKALLHKALQNSRDQFDHYELFEVQSRMQQKRQLLSLEQGHISVMWTMTSAQREQEALAIRVPLMMGLMGYRLLVVNDADRQAIAQANEAKLKAMTSFQGHDWPDLEILKANGYNTKPFSFFLGLYKQLSLRKFDFYPRGILEAYREVEVGQYKNLSVDQSKLLYYPTAIYFFVAKDNTQLAARIEVGLQAMVESGDLEKFLINYGTHKKDLARAALNKRTLYTLRNPLLSEETPINDARYWLTVDEIQALLK